MKINLDLKADTMLRQMANESGLSKADLVEIAVFNLIAVWMREKKISLAVPVVAPDGVSAADGGAPHSGEGL